MLHLRHIYDGMLCILVTVTGWYHTKHPLYCGHCHTMHESLKCRKVLWHGAHGFTSRPKKVLLRICIVLGRVWTCKSWVHWQALDHWEQPVYGFVGWRILSKISVDSSVIFGHTCCKLRRGCCCCRTRGRWESHQHCLHNHQSPACSTLLQSRFWSGCTGHTCRELKREHVKYDITWRHSLQVQYALHFYMSAGFLMFFIIELQNRMCVWIYIY
jgi:hypothetical protein